MSLRTRWFSSPQGACKFDQFLRAIIRNEVSLSRPYPRYFGVRRIDETCSIIPEPETLGIVKAALGLGNDKEEKEKDGLSIEHN